MKNAVNKEDFKVPQKANHLFSDTGKSPTVEVVLLMHRSRRPQIIH